MRVSLRWLSDYIDLPTENPSRIRDALAGLGHEVEGIEHLAAGWTGVVVAKVVTVEPHPNADKVRLCTVTTGGEPVEVVCGAWNFEAGAVVAWAPPGARLAGDFEIGRRRIRGVDSNGMICSERELQLGDDHAGILVLDVDTPVGVDLAEVVELPDVVFDVTITPNRPDVMSMVGVARELGAVFGVPYRRPDSSLTAVPGEPSTEVKIEDPDGCLRFTLRELHGVRSGPSPFWMQRRLRAAGMRPISNAVDVTNYVMLELGHPLHAFDGDRIAGDRLVVRRAHEGERLVTLDGVERLLTTADLAICDDDGPTSLAGTMGGEASEVRHETARVLLEAATWDPPTIMWMARRHGLRSEASARFERGVDPNLPLEASARAARLLLESSGGELLEGVTDVVAVASEPRQIELAVADVTRTLGEGFDADDIAALLRALELTVEAGEPMRVTVPTFRPDLTRPIDLVEEVARLRGYDSFGERVPTSAGGGWTKDQRRAKLLRSVLAGVGISQTAHLSFIGAADLDRFGFPEAHEARQVVRVTNPLRDEESMLRTTLLPALLHSLRYNRGHGAESVALFEIGKVFFHRPADEDPRVPDQPDRLGFVAAGPFGPSDLSTAARPADVFTAAAVWRLIARRLSLSDWELQPGRRPGFHPGRCADVTLRGQVIGTVGELHPMTVEAFGLEGRVAAGELELSPLIAPVSPPQLDSPSPFPHVEFDLAFMVDPATAAAELVAVTTRAGGDLVESARVFDEYTGGEENRRSLAVRYVLRASDRTLTNEEVAPIRKSMVEAAAALGAHLRGEA